jgi:hypothetical protein
LLSQRVDQLSQFITENGLQAPAIPEHEELALQKVLTTIGLPYERVIGRHIEHGANSSNSESADLNAQQGENAGFDSSPGATTDLNFGDSHISNKRSRTEHQGNQPENPSFMEPVIDSDLQASAGSQSSPVPGDTNEVGTALDSTQQTTQVIGSQYWNWNSVDSRAPAFDANYAPQFSSVQPTTSPDTSAVQSTFNHALAERYLSAAEDTDDDDGSVEELVDQLSDRIGTMQIGPNGQMRFYGPTSNFTLMDMPSTDPLHVHRSIRNDGQEYLDRLEVGAEVPFALEEHLINLYFTWQDPFFHIVDRDMYEVGKKKWHEEKQDTPYFSEALRNAM